MLAPNFVRDGLVPLRTSLCRLSRPKPTSIRLRAVAKEPPGDSRPLGRERAAVARSRGSLEASPTGDTPSPRAANDTRR
jgi:hypothetical protein